MSKCFVKYLQHSKINKCLIKDESSEFEEVNKHFLIILHESIDGKFVYLRQVHWIHRLSEMVY